MTNDNLILYCVNTFIKSILVSSLIYKCIEIPKLEKLLKFIVYFIYTLLLGVYINLFIYDNVFLKLTVFHLFQFFIIYILYNKEKISSLIGFSIAYYILCIYWSVDIGVNEYIMYTNSINSFNKYNLFENIVLIIIIFLCIYSKDKITKTVEVILEDKRITTIFICGTFVFNIFLGIFYSDLLKLNNVKIILIFIIYIGMIILINYLMKIINKSYILDQLNKEMEIKNDQLRKIKHDYGAQISYLYGLFLLKRWDDLKEAIDKIVDMNKDVSSGVIIDNLDDSLIKDAFKPILNKGIHVAIEENVYLNNINIDKDELFKIVSEVGKALANLINEGGIILAKTYISIDNIIIKVECSGIIYEKQLKDYSIMDELRNRLVIINKIVTKNGGKILLKYNNISTEIKVFFPI